MRNATSESCRISLSVSCDTVKRAYCSLPVERAGKTCGLGRRFGFQVLMRRAIVAVRQRRALARLALARGRAAACDAAVECARLDLLLDELRRRGHAGLHGPCDLRLGGDGEVAADVLDRKSTRL